MKTRAKRRLLSLVCVVLTAAALTAHTLAAKTTAVVEIADNPVPLASAGGTYVYTPQSPGTVTYTGGSAVVDASNASEGYITVRYSGNKSRAKVQITRAGSGTYTYDLNTNGVYEVFPLTSGNGTYSVGVFENVGGSQYAQSVACSFSVTLRNQMLPFLYPSQYVNFHAGSATVQRGATLAAGAATELDVVSAVYNYVIQNISYDTQKAQTVQSGYLPAVDSILASGRGICFDYAAVMAAMLRTQQIPTRLEVGYVSNGAYHAWISTYVQDTGWVNTIYFDGTGWKLMDPTFASSGNQSDSIMQYIGNGSNYRTQYIY